MKHVRKLIALLVITTLLTALPTPASAASYTIEAIKPNHWYTLRDYSQTMPIHKIKLTGESVVSFLWKNVKASSMPGLGFFLDRGCNDSLDYFDLSSGSGSDSIVLYPGTYYIQMYDDNERAKIKFSVRRTSTINKANYCLSKASVLKAGKKTEIAQTLKNNYDRWYRIKLCKKQSISFYGLEEYDFSLYDVNLNEIFCSGHNSKCKTVGKQPRGTYYVRIYGAYLSDLVQKGKYLVFYWK